MPDNADELMQLTLNLEEGLVESYGTCRELVQAQTIILAAKKQVQQKHIAAEMDYSPSQLTRKLAQGESDSARFTLDDLESWIAVTGDKTPVLYLAEKYLSVPDVKEIEAEIQRLQQQLKVAGNGQQGL